MKPAARVFILTFALLTVFGGANAKDWDIKDDNLKDAIRTELGVHNRALAASDALLLFTLRAVGAEIRSLEGLEEAANLEKLVIGANKIDDLAPISGLSNLKELHAWNCEITNLDALVNLQGLEALQLGGNQIDNIKPLKELTKLEWLDLSHNHIADITALSDMRKLKWLDLRRNEISDITALNDLTSLEKLWIADNDISDLSPIYQMTQLQWLVISGNWISDVSVLDALPEIKRIHAHDNVIDLASGGPSHQLFDRLRAKKVVVFFEPQNLYAIHEKLPLDLPE